MSLRLTQLGGFAVVGGAAPQDWTNWDGSQDGTQVIVTTNADSQSGEYHHTIADYTDTGKMVFWSQGTALHARSVDGGETGSVIALGTDLTVFTSSDGDIRGMDAIQVAPDKWLIAYDSTTSNTLVVLLATLSGTWSVGSTTNVSTAGMPGNARVGIASMGVHWAIGYGGPNVADHAIALVDFSGTTVTVQDAQQELSSQSAYSNDTIARINDSACVSVYADNNEGVQVHVSTRSGGTLTPQAAIETFVYDGAQGPLLEVDVWNDVSSRIAVLSKGNGGNLNLQEAVILNVCDWSGSVTTETAQHSVVPFQNDLLAAISVSWASSNVILTARQNLTDNDLKLETISWDGSNLGDLTTDTVTGHGSGIDMTRLILLDPARQILMTVYSNTIDVMIVNAEV